MATYACVITDPVYICQPRFGLMAYINYAPMRIGAEDPWALTELAKAGGPGGAAPPQPRGVWGVPPTR